jgi:hypothetical protein
MCSYHSMAGELGICLEDTVCGTVVAGSVHGIRASLIERGRKADIASIPTGDSDFGHCDRECNEDI